MDREGDTLTDKNWLPFYNEPYFTLETALSFIPQPSTQKGDIWLLDRHKLFCNDCFELRYDEQYSMIFADPPYGDIEIISKLPALIEKIAKNTNIFIMSDDEGIVTYLRNSKLKFKRFFVISFGFPLPKGNEPYLRHYLMIHEVMGQAHKHNNLHDGFSTIITIEYRGKIKEKRIHPHQKGIKSLSQLILHFTDENERILDLFAGSGSMILACHQTNRICDSVEIEPRFCDLIVKRYYDITKSENIWLFRDGQKIHFRNIFDNMDYPYWIPIKSEVKK